MNAPARSTQHGTAPAPSPLDLTKLPGELRALLHAVGRVRDRLPVGEDELSSRLWAQVDAACLTVWENDTPPPAEDIAIQPLVPGFAMLACRCGRAIGVGSMYRPESGRPAARQRSGILIDRIVCSVCAVKP